MPSSMNSLDLGPNVVNGLRALSTKGDGLTSVGAGCPGKARAVGGPSCPLPLVLRVPILVVFGRCLPLPRQALPQAWL